MPLAFESRSHGTVAFGFFNIESDLLLLDRYFLFATELCERIEALAREPSAGRLEAVWPVFRIDRRQDIGDLHGAIAGTRFSGFIGDTYRKYPFPSDPAGFRQKTRGDCTQAEFLELIAPYAKRIDIPFVADPEADEVAIGDYRFGRTVFHELIRYVLVGGYPRWQDDTPPDYVLAMKRCIEDAGASHWLFEPSISPGSGRRRRSL